MAGVSAFGTTLEMGRGNDVAAAGDVFDTIVNVTELGAPSLTLDTIDVTAHDSPGAVEEVIATIIRTGEVTVEFNYDPTEPTHMGDITPGVGTGEGLAAALLNRSIKNFKMRFPTTPAAGWDFKGIVTGVEGGAPYDDKLTGSATIKVTGVPTFV